MGNFSWAKGTPVFQVVELWIAFLVVTIVAERLELSRLAPVPRWASRACPWLAALFAVAAGLRAQDVAGASRAFGILGALLAAYLLQFDIARRTMRGVGLARFSAVGVLCGAVWLLLACGWLSCLDLPVAGPFYDVPLHAVFVGYVLSMVFAHAPIIVPAVLGVQAAFQPLLYVPLVALHGSLACRLLGGIFGSALLRQVGAVGNVFALALFAVTFAFSARRQRVRT